MLVTDGRATAGQDPVASAHRAAGLLSAAGVLLTKRGNPVATIVGMVGSLTAGAYAPVDTFPHWLRWVARVLLGPIGAEAE